MAERIPQSTAKKVVFRAFLSSDGKTPATGKTIAITISKNGATSFSNPAAGATNATEMASGFYEFDLGTGDTDTKGPLAWRGAEASINDAGDVYEVVNATNAGFTGIPDAAAGANTGLPLGDASGRVDVGKVGGTSQTARDLGASVLLSSGTGTGQISLSSGAVLLQATQPGVTIPTVTTVGSVSGAVGSVTGNIGGNVTGSIGSLATQAKADVNAEVDTALSDAGVTSVRQAHLDADVSSRLASGSYTAPDNSSITAIKAKTDNLPTDPADASDIASAFAAVPASVGAQITSDHGAGSYVRNTEPLDAAGVRTAVGLANANLDSQLDALPTNAELATALAAADDATLAAIAALSIPTVSAIAAQVRIELATELARVDVPTSTRSAAGDAMALTPTERNAVADAHLDRADGIETGVTPRQAQRLQLAASVGKTSGPIPGQSGTVAIRDVNDATDRVSASVDENGYRTAVTLDAG